MKPNQRIPKSVKYLDQGQFFTLFDQFIHASYKGKRTTKSGQTLRSSSSDSYLATQRLLIKFVETEKFNIKLPLVNHLSQTEQHKAAKYWQEFYKKFTSFLYDKEGHFDNYVGCTCKNIKTFLNYLNNDRLLNVGQFHRKFHVPSEDIPIVVLTPKQLNYLIHDKPFVDSLPEDLKITRDIFIIGCTVALRVSDLMNLRPFNLEKKSDNVYLTVHSGKTGTKTSIVLPDYAIDIFKKYQKKHRTLLPKYTRAHLNRQLKRLGTFLLNNEEMIKTRMKRGKPVVVYKDAKNKKHYTLADHITTHTMRRTAITTMLLLGMPDQFVRMLSGHTKSSKEFFKYVEFTQSVLDSETQKVFEKLNNLA